MISDARDIAAVIDFGRRLQELREMHLKRVIAGEKVPPDFWQKGEQGALEYVKRRYFSLKNRLNFMPKEKAEAVSDAQDFESRSSKLTEALTLESHKKLVAVPYVGHPDYKDV